MGAYAPRSKASGGYDAIFFGQDSSGDDVEICVRNNVPDETQADEIARAAERAYWMGRVDEREHFEVGLRQLIDSRHKAIGRKHLDRAKSQRGKR